MGAQLVPIPRTIRFRPFHADDVGASRPGAQRPHERDLKPEAAAPAVLRSKLDGGVEQVAIADHYGTALQAGQHGAAKGGCLR